MADQDIKMLIERIMAEARTHQSARFSNETYADEPILKTGRQMQNFLPDQYRKMREISRWQDDPKGNAKFAEKGLDCQIASFFTARAC